MPVLDKAIGKARPWLSLLRVHQWAKNGLVFVPLVMAQRFDLLAFGQAIGAFMAFSLAASAVYILNDIVDLDADRQHPRKKFRPLAAGVFPIRAALALVPPLLAAAFYIAATVSAFLAVVLLAYLALTTAYTFLLKRKMLVDVLTRASLYTMRVGAGAVAISVPMSEWLLAFSMFIFTALALTKRYVELTNPHRPKSVGSRGSQLPQVRSLHVAAASGRCRRIQCGDGFCALYLFRCCPPSLSPSRGALDHLPYPDVLVRTRTADGAPPVDE